MGSVSSLPPRAKYYCLTVVIRAAFLRVKRYPRHEVEINNEGTRIIKYVPEDSEYDLGISHCERHCLMRKDSGIYGTLSFLPCEQG